MSCTIDSKVLRTALEKALRTNPEKYRNLENSVRDVMRLSNLTDEVKVKVIAAYSELYKHLSRKSTAFELNNLDTFLDARVVPMIDDTSLSASRFTEALSMIQEQLGVTPATGTTQNIRAKELAVALSEAIESPLVGRYARIKAVADTVVQERSLLDAGMNDSQELNSVKLLENAIDKLQNSGMDKNTVRNLMKALSPALAQLRTPNSENGYIDLRLIPELSSNRFEAYLSDGSIVDLLKEGESYMILDENLQSTGEVYDLSANPAPKAVFPVPSSWIANDGATLLINGDEINTGLVMIGADLEAFSNEVMSSTNNPVNTVTVVANNSNAARNAARFNIIRQAVAQYPALANRTIETRESAAQVRALQSGKPVLTRARLSDGFSLQLVSPSGKMVTVLNYNDYVVVFPDNTTRRLDLENEEDLNLFAQLTNIRYTKGAAKNTVRPTTMDDLYMLRDGARRYKAFEAEVNALLDKGETTIPTSVFSKYFELQNQVYYNDFTNSYDTMEKVYGERFDQFVNKHNGGFSVDVVNINDKTNPTKRQLPAIFAPVYTTRNARRGDAWRPIELLGPDEYVLHEGKIYKWKEYVEKVLMSTMGDSISKLSLLSGHRYASLFPVSGTKHAVIPLIRNKQPKVTAQYADVLLNLGRFVANFTSTTPTKTYTNNFNNEVFGFEIVSGVRADFFTNIGKNGKPYLAVQFNAKDTHADAAFFNENASLLNFAVSSDPLDKIMETVKAFYESQGLDFVYESAADAKRIAEELNGLFTNAAGKEAVQKLQEEIDNIYQKFTKDVHTKFGKKLDSLLNHPEAETREMAQQMIGTKEKFMFQLFEQVENKPVLKVQNKETTYRDLSSYYTYKSNMFSRLSLRYNMVSPFERSEFSDALDEMETLVVPPIDLFTTEQDVENNFTMFPGATPESGSSRLDDFDMFDPFEGGAASLGDALQLAAFEQGEFQRQVDYIRERLPKDIAIDDLDKIVRNLDAEGNVLGYIKDKVIYLNENLSRPGTAYHEAFHAVFRYLLSPEERANLLSREYESMGIISESAIAEFRKQRRGLAHMSNTEVIELMAEERMADKFQSYAIKKTKPQTWYAKLFNLIQRLIEFFTKHKNEIEQTFDRIHSGFYSSASAKEYSGVEGAYQLIKTVPTMGLLDGKIKGFTESMNAADMMELRNMMVYEMLRTKNAAGMTADQRYDEVANMLRSYYNIDNFIRQRPDAESFIRSKYETKLRDFRYVLGGLQNGEKYAVLNLTGDPRYDNKFIDGTNEGVIAQNAQESYRQMKQMVLEIVENLNTTDTIENALATGAINETDSGDVVMQAKADVEETGAKDPDISLLETGTSDGDREFRKIFQFLVYEQEDFGVGITIRRPVDADKLFDSVKKITVNTPKAEILPQIRQRIETLEQDLEHINRLLGRISGYPAERDNTYELAQSLKAMMNMLTTTCGIENNIPTRNEAMFNQFHSVFYVASGEISRVDIKTKREFDAAGVAISSEMRVVDVAQTQDNFAALNKVIDGYNNTYRLLPETSDGGYFRASKKQIQADLKETMDIILERGSKEISTFYLENGEFSDAMVNKLADDLYVISSSAGLGLPRHFFHFSLVAMIQASGYRIPEGSEARSILMANTDIYKEKGYMTPSMLTAMRYMFSYSDKVPLFENTANKTRKSVVASFLPAMMYVTRYDQSIGQPVVMNTTGNKIYRFTLYSPNMQVVQDLQQLGLNEFVKDVYGQDFVSWFNDNPYLQEGVLSDLLQEYLKVGYLNGLSQQIDEGDNINTDVSKIDKKGYHLSNLALFADRKSYSRAGQKLTTFKRITSQNDATGTVFHVTGRYEEYMTTVGNAKTEFNGKKVSMISARLAGLIQQEYNRIQKEYQERDVNKTRYNDYNGKLLADGTVDTTSAKLRAYNFHHLDSFFLNEIGATDSSIVDENVAARVYMREQLIAAAKEGKSFADTLSSPALAPLFEQLDLYAQDEFEFFLENLENEKIIEKVGADYSTAFFDTSYKLNGENKTGALGNSLKTHLNDYFFNDWVNRLLVNQLFDGDKAVGIKSAVDYYKRLKSQAAAGKNAESASRIIKHGTSTYRHVVITTPGNKEIPVYFDPSDLTKPQQHSSEGMENYKAFEIMDGHVYQTLNHRMKFLSAEGKLDARSEEIIRSLRYKRASFEEIEYLESRGIQLNPQKTVTAHPIHYLKMSEHYINRLTVSYYRAADKRAARDRVAEMYKLLDLYEGQLDLGIEVNENGESIERLYRDTVTKIHQEFAPINGRQMLHSMLNNMEYHRLGQLSDNSASKRGTIIPASVTIEQLESGDTYWDLDNHVATIPMRYAYNQVATEMHHHDVTDSIQPKLLIDTDIDLKDPNVPEDLKKLVRTYRTLLNNMSVNSRKKFERVVKKGGKIDTANFYKMIQESLQKQGAPQHMLKMWDVVDGEPVHSANLPGITEALKYYVFSSANASLFQPKAPGYKFYHGSSFGYKIIVDENDVPVPDEEIRKNPEKYNNYETRYPSFRKTINAEGVEEYYVEVLIPRPTSTNPKKLRVLEKSLEEFFGTRIPTEDKRSMVRVKVAGYIDATYINTIVVPEQIHYLSGSDKDIDALYVRMLGTYDNVLGELNIYGDYSEYEDRYGMDAKTARFVEYLHYMMNDPFFGPLVSKELRRMKEDAGYKVENLKESAAMFGPKVQEFFTRSMDDIMSAMQSRFRDLKESKQIQTTGKKFTSFEDLRDIVDAQGDESSVELQRQLRLLEKMAAVVNVLQGTDMPVTAEELMKYEKANGSPVIPIIQNEITSVMNKILGHNYVFDNLYSKEFSNADIYKNAVDKLGRDEKDTIGQSNFATITSVSNVRDSNKSAKRGIEIFAAFNKGLSIAVKHGLKLQEPIWNINGKTYKSFSIEDGDDPSRQRAHALIGNSLGMSADAAKNPYPAVLSLNQYNMAVTATMLSLGIDPYLSIYINLMPSVKNAVSVYEAEAEGSVRRSYKNGTSLSTHLFNTLTYKLNELSVGDAAQQAFAKDFTLSDYTFNFDVENVDPNIVNSDNPTVDSMGVEVVNTKGLELTAEMKDVVMLAMFIEQQKQAEAIRYELGPLTDAQKSLSPDFNTIDRLKNVYSKDRDESVFEGYKNIFSESPVYNDLGKSIELFDEMTSEVFLERTPLVKELTKQINAAIYAANPQQISSHIKSYLALNVLKNTITTAMQDPELEKNSPVVHARYSSFLSMLNADYWYNNNMPNTINRLKREFRGNAFLDAIDVFNGKNGLKLVRSVSKAKVSPEREIMIMNGLDQLLTNSDATVREAAYQIFYYSIVKDGMSAAPYSLRRFLNPDNFREVSNQLKKVEKAFDTLNQAYQENAGMDFRKAFESEFKSLLGENSSLDFVIEDVMEKIISIYDPTADESKVKVLNYTNERGKFTGYGVKAMQEAIESMRPSMGAEIFAEAEANAHESRNLKRKFKLNKKRAEDTGKPVSNNDLFLPDSNDEVVLNMANASKLNNEMFDKIAMHNSIYPRRVNAETLTKEYSFPLYVTNTYGDLMVLNEVDGQKLGSKLFDKIEEQMSNDASQINGNPFVGTKAVYKIVKRQGDANINPIAFSTKEAVKLNDYATGALTPSITTIDETGGTYKGITVLSAKDMVRQGTGEPGAAKFRRADNTIVIDRDTLYDKYYEKAWTSPLKQRDGSFATAFPENTFNNYNDWETFVLEHERQHMVLGPKQLNEEYGAYEDRVNRAALAALFPGMDLTFLDAATQAPADQSVNEPILVSTPEQPLEIYVDGSHIKGTGMLGYGAAVKHNGRTLSMSGTEESKAFKSFQAKFPSAKFSNPTMEMLGLVMTLNTFKDTAEHLVIKQDYKGVVNYGALWNRSEGSLQREPKPWNAKETYIQYLVDKAVEMIERIESNGGTVKLQWVKGHSKDVMNDAADAAAKDRSVFNQFGLLFEQNSVEKVIQSKTEESKECNNN